MPKTPDDPRLDLLQGTLDMLILRTLQWGPRHGHGIGQTIRAQSEDLLRVETGSLYPALHRLVRRGWLKARRGWWKNCATTILGCPKSFGCIFMRRGVKVCWRHAP